MPTTGLFDTNVFDTGVFYHSVGIFDTGIFDTGIFDHPAEALTVRAPSFSHWRKTRNKNKPQAPQLPEPVHPGEVVIDEAVLLQMEEERIAAMMKQKKAEALERVVNTRDQVEELKARIVLSGRFDEVATSAGVRTRVVTLFRPPPRPPATEPVRGSSTLRALGPRYLPNPEIAKAREILLRRARSQATSER